jgi:hypothetical protein
VSNKDIALEKLREKLDIALEYKENRYKILLSALKELTSIISNEYQEADKTRRKAWRKSFDFILNDLF